MIDYLSWDSEFFGKKIGSVGCDKNTNIIDLVNLACKSNYDLIYVFSQYDLLAFNNDRKLLKKVDKKIDYTIDLNSELLLSDYKVEEYLYEEMVDELEKLAYQSGAFSRFKKDEMFDKQYYYRLYYMWIYRSVKREIADKVFVIRDEDGIIKAMATLKIGQKKSRIGLIAVDSDSYGKGFGRAIINKCINISKEFGSEKLSVTTQFDNRNACIFYEKCGFRVEEEIFVYHLWL